jgi:hypothetical protein
VGTRQTNPPGRTPLQRSNRHECSVRFVTRLKACDGSGYSIGWCDNNTKLSLHHTHQGTGACVLTWLFIGSLVSTLCCKEDTLFLGSFSYTSRISAAKHRSRTQHALLQRRHQCGVEVSSVDGAVTAVNESPVLEWLLMLSAAAAMPEVSYQAQR